MGDESSRDPNSDYEHEYNDDIGGPIRRSRRIRLKIKHPESKSLRYLVPSNDEDEENYQEERLSRSSERLSSRYKSYQNGYMNMNYENESRTQSSHNYSLRRLRNRMDISEHKHNVNRSDDSSGLKHMVSRDLNPSCEHKSATISPRRLRVRTKKINYEERRPLSQIEEETITNNTSYKETKNCRPNPLYSFQGHHRSPNVFCGIGSGGARLFGNDAEDEEHIIPVLQYSQCVKQIKLLPKNQQKENEEILQMHLENKDFPEVPSMTFSNVSFNDIIGHDEHILTLREMLELTLNYPELVNKGLEIPKGFLFYGPPGTGKTMAARALASSCSTPQRPVSFYFCSCTDVHSKWFGESEKYLKQLFDQARNSEPSIVFFDEVDGLTPTRSPSENAHYNTIVNTLLSLMDGVKERGRVIVIAATNRLDAIDPAFLRPGRFDRILEFGLPDRKTREKMIEKQTASFKISNKVISNVARSTQGYNGADMKFLCTAAFFRALRRQHPDVIKSKGRVSFNIENIRVKMSDFSSELLEMRHKSDPDRFIDMDTGIDKLLSSTCELIFSVLDGNYKIIVNKRLPQMYKINNYYEPRLLISGLPRMGQIQLGYLIRKWLIDKSFKVEMITNPNKDNIENIISSMQYSNMRSLIILNVESWVKPGDNILEYFEMCLGEFHNMPILIIGIETTVEPTKKEILSFFECKTEIVEKLFNLRGCIKIQSPTRESRRRYFKIFENELRRKLYRKLKYKNREEKENKNPSPANTEDNIGPLESLEGLFSESEIRKAEQRFQEVFVDLKQKLREFHRFLGKKYRIFTQSFDKEKYPGYYSIVDQAMDLDTILANVDANRYLHPDDWMNDIDIIFQNAFLYHTKVRQIQEIMHKAYEFRDYAGYLLNTIPSISKLNYWQLKIWNDVRNQREALKSSQNKNLTSKFQCQKGVTSSDEYLSQEAENDTRHSPNENSVQNTPVIKTKRHEAPLEKDTPESPTKCSKDPDMLMDCSSQKEPANQSNHETKNKHEDKCLNDKDVEDEDNSTDSSLDDLIEDPNICNACSKIVERLEEVTSNMSVNDVLALSSVLWNEIAPNDNDVSVDDLISVSRNSNTKINFLQNVNRLISQVDNHINSNAK